MARNVAPPLEDGYKRPKIRQYDCEKIAQGGFARRRKKPYSVKRQNKRERQRKRRKRKNKEEGRLKLIDFSTVVPASRVKLSPSLPVAGYEGKRPMSMPEVVIVLSAFLWARDPEIQRYTRHAHEGIITRNGRE
ncbi:hypothetical protein MGYG_08944 [Nannizzia gypsea CBS 118893]|uniref:Uncharacterized protein n=1 Tax=Arthroderma gypseum (strain ATCC MYA-4604 / CBS 118893) TaxID=535722 RepID=E5R2M3_ARTGP|nr:hypothetical protein MGYG_08944 [Nannizzia gypsea CBS 118893]EFQ98681.1 hypothetical protein MGYG_08944 [Nannizzia gypsea CBS 118893]